MKTSTLYRQRLDKLIAALKASHDDYFEMGTYLMNVGDVDHNFCGTAGCIAGHAAMLATRTGPRKNYLKVSGEVSNKAYELRDKKYGDVQESNVKLVAMEWLGLNAEEAKALFTPNLSMGRRINLSIITRKDALAALRILKKKKYFNVEFWEPIIAERYKQRALAALG